TAYHTPMVLRDVDRLVYGDETAPISMEEVLDVMCDYADRHIADGGRLAHISRHMVGLFQGQAGSRRWRQILSTDATRNDADSKIIRKAY
ncbi:tRNA dihydrouridine(20/20a) synthase DusA, partial [Salmonella enterica]|nr:tRNA dihydrouridine(20/20a) synthase DusA [Salmonella enterica]